MPLQTDVQGVMHQDKISLITTLMVPKLITSKMEACGGSNQEETSLQKHCAGMQERKVKVHLELKLARDVKGRFYWYSSS